MFTLATVVPGCVLVMVIVGKELACNTSFKKPLKSIFISEKTFSLVEHFTKISKYINLKTRLDLRSH